jgi:hypothetical protein
VTSPGVIREWLREHPSVYHLRRTLKFSNPGKNVDEDRRQMRALTANRKTEEFASRTTADGPCDLPCDPVRAGREDR